MERFTYKRFTYKQQIELARDFKFKSLEQQLEHWKVAVGEKIELESNDITETEIVGNGTFYTVIVIQGSRQTDSNTMEPCISFIQEIKRKISLF